MSHPWPKEPGGLALLGLLSPQLWGVRWELGLRTVKTPGKHPAGPPGSRPFLFGRVPACEVPKALGTAGVLRLMPVICTNLGKLVHGPWVS